MYGGIGQQRYLLQGLCGLKPPEGHDYYPCMVEHMQKRELLSLQARNVSATLRP